MLDHRAARRQVAVQHRHRTLRLDRIVAAADDILAGHLLRTGNRIAQRAADGFRIEVDQIAELLHQLGHAAGVMEMLHVVRA